MSPIDQAGLDLIVLKERYLVQQFIARGGMAMIYRGLDLQRNCTVALKIVHETNNTPFPYAQYLFHEASIISSLHHPHIVQIYDKGQQDALSFIVLEFIEGTQLIPRNADAAFLFYETRTHYRVHDCPCIRRSA